ncbi:MAG: hypothetical protein DHS20C18_46580 [Saprospiraceae bacterium]|nr:MAG: hypothetical protein DHS20C18_46580 [Saprospiraceae bacterium]
MGQSPYFKTHDLPQELKFVDLKLLYQSEGGFIWLGSREGLIRYDGSQYKVYQKPDTLGQNHVSAVFQDKNDLIWVGYRDGSIYQLDHRDVLQAWQPEEGLPVVPITGFAEDLEQRLWFSTYGEGLYYLDGEHVYNYDTDDGLLGNDIYCLVTDHRGWMWTGTDGGISICWLEQGEKKIKNITREHGLQDDIVRAILPDEKGNCWVGTYDHGISYLKTDNFEFEYPMSDWDMGQINDLEYFQGRELWIGTEGQGLWRWDFRDKKHYPVGQENFQSAKIYNLHKDIEGNLWVISNNGGLQSTNRQFEFVEKPVSNIQALLVDHDDQLWLGTPQGLFRQVKDSLSKSSFERVLSENVLCLFQDNYHNIWAGTFGSGILLLNQQLGKQRHITEKDGLTNASILSIDGNGDHIWCATLGGVTEFECRMNPLSTDALSVRNYNHESGLGTNFIYKIFLDSKNRTWFGTDGEGISMLDQGKITNFSEAGEIPIKSVYSITEDRRGHIWFSTARSGVFEFDGSKLINLAVKEGIRDLSITGLATDDKGQILIIHPSGIDILDPESHHLIYYDTDVGIDDFEPNLNAFYLDNAGNVWIGSQREIIRYTALEEKLEIHPRTRFTGISIDLEPINIESQNKFAHNKNSLAFDYVGLWFTDPETVKYRYKLEGFDHEWIVSRDNRAVYSNLPPGSYSFLLMSTENDAFDKEPLVSYSFSIQRPFWSQWWFVLLTLTGGASLVFYLVKTREKRLQREALLKKEKIESKYEALKSQINPHFLFNSFNTLIAIIEEEPSLAVEYVEKLSDFYRSILQYREKELISLDEELNLVNDYAFLLKKRYGDHLKLQVNIAEKAVYIAPLTLQILVENAVKHNVISKSRPLLIQICLSEKGYICVSNNLQKKLTPSHSTGFGLQSIVNRYGLLSDKKVFIEETAEQFTVGIPVIKNSLF